MAVVGADFDVVAFGLVFEEVCEDEVFAELASALDWESWCSAAGCELLFDVGCGDGAEWCEELFALVVCA